jgi:hypothetical protein
MKSLTKPLALGAALLAAGALPLFLYAVNPMGLLGAGAENPVGTASQCALLASRDMGSALQWLAVITAFGIKPVYLVISLATIIALWRRTEADLVALRWGLIIFWLGENACSTNYLVYQGRSEFWEYLHNFGMAAAFSFVAFALMEGLDRRVVRYTAPKDRCAMMGLCRSCIKYTDSPCKLRRVFMLLIPAAIVVALIPFCSAPHPVAYQTRVLGGPVLYCHFMSAQLFEVRYCPTLGIVLLTSGWLALMFRRHEPMAMAKLLVAAAAGPLGFGFSRFILFAAFSDNLFWFDVWEEFTELLFTASTACILWLFRDSLFGGRAPATPPTPS